jgi:PAS domain S-box-containing protein
MKSKENNSTAMIHNDGGVPLESVLCTEELKRRPARPPDYHTENRALMSLAQALADSPETILQRLADTILEVLGVGTAGVSLLAQDESEFYWPAVAGAWKEHLGGGTPRDFGPCGDVLDCNAPLMFQHAERRYTYIQAVTPPMEEALLVPFHVAGKAVGTIWAITHGEMRQFDSEDLRKLISLGRFASSAYQATTSLKLFEQQRERLRQSQADLTTTVLELQKSGGEASEARRAALNLMEDAVSSREAVERLNVDLRESEERFRMVADNISQLAWTCDRLGDVTWYNRRWLEYTGFSLEDMNGWDWAKVQHPEHIDRVVAGVKRSAEADEPWEDTFPLRGKDGTYRWFFSLAVPIRDASGKTVRWFGTNTDITVQRTAEEALRDAQKLLERSHRELELLVEQRTAAVRKLSADVIHLQDDERRRISRELHDSVGQYLAHAKMGVDGLMKAGMAEKEAKALSRVSETLDKCLAETRTISHLLHPPLLDEIGLASAARWYVEGFSERSGIQVNLSISEKLNRLPGALELVLFRVLQESLTNVHRHADTRSVDIQVQVGAGEVMLEVRDHGKGIPPQLLERFRTTGQGAGIGLAGMRERIHEQGGLFEIQSTKGTLVRVVIPLSNGKDTCLAASP